MAEPTSGIGCVLGCFFTLAALFFYFAVFATAYTVIPFLGFLLANRIWRLDRASAICVLVPSTFSFLIGTLIVAHSYTAPTPTQREWDILAYSFGVIILVELTVFAVRRKSAHANFRTAGQLALKMGLISIGTGLLLVVLTVFSPFQV